MEKWNRITLGKDRRQKVEIHRRFIGAERKDWGKAAETLGKYKTRESKTEHRGKD